MIVDFHYRLEENLEALLFHHANLKTNGVVVGFWAKEPGPLRIHLDVSRDMDVVDTSGLQHFERPEGKRLPNAPQVMTSAECHPFANDNGFVC